ncbi:MAG: sigma-70 family RNA polymerase sigma factor [Dehalococcoidia bacterium]|nr:sigma-70 family RNA polymerase sigma factor [Dehalococcoidia bacterium]
MIAVLEEAKDLERVSYDGGDSDLGEGGVGRGEELDRGGVRSQKREFETGDDVLNLYFGEVGQTPLLNAGEEKLLGRQIEDGKHLARLEDDLAQDGAAPSAVDLVVALSERLSRVRSLSQALYRYVGVPSEASITEQLTHADVRRAVDGHIDEGLSTAIAEMTGEDLTEIEGALVQLSLDSRLMPWHVMEEAGQSSSVADFEQVLRSPQSRDQLESRRSEIARHFEQVRERARKATNQMIQANLRLVVSVAKGHANRGVPLHDIIQEGNIGLMQAVKKFDHRRGYKFSTYAIPWIWQAINRAVNEQSRLIHLPGYLIDDLTKMARVRSSLCQELGRQPTEAELSSEMGLPLEKIEALINLNSGGHVSFEMPLGEEGSRLGEFIADDDIEQPEELAATSLLSEELSRTLESLTPRERRVIELRFGLGDEYSHTLAEVGTELGLTKERIRQIEKEALAKLRHLSHSRELIGYLG